MKSRIIILGICVLLSACGLGKRSENPSAIDENASENIFITNLKTQNYGKIQQIKSGNRFYFLGKFDASSLPSAIRGLPTESEIGTLSLEFEDEIYTDKYDGEVRSVFIKREQEIKATVYVIKDNDSPNQITFAIKDDDLAKQVRVHEESLTVKSSPKEYCYRTHFYIKQLVDKIAVLDQDALCNPSGICAISVRMDWPSSRDVPGTYNLNERPVQVVNSCLDTQTYYSVTETRINRSIPKVAVVNLNSSFLNTKMIHFDL